VVFAGGLPDLRLLPHEELARAYRRVLRLHGKKLLSYGDPHGHPHLRQAVAGLVSARRALAAKAENVLITRGSQMALDLCARLLISPGDRVAVEAWGYHPAWAALRAAGAELVPVEVDDQGMKVQDLERLTQRQKLRAIYLTPQHQFPTTVTLSPGRRLWLLGFCRRQRVIILEDDYDHEFHYDGRPVLPLASADDAGVVIYIGTLSKILAPGLRLGFVVAPSPLIDELAKVRLFADRQGDLATECAVAELLEDGLVQRHVRRMRRVYQCRRDALMEALQKQLSDEVTFDVPKGGIALWITTCVNVEEWARRTWKEGAVFYPASEFAFDGAYQPHARLGFACLTEDEIQEGVKRMVKALPRK
jgi:GntR family transcriptional regulator/MocR family aminotransferase